METYNRCLLKERKQTNYYSITITIQHSLSFWSKNADQKRKIWPSEFLPQAVLRHLDIRRRIKLDLVLIPREKRRMDQRPTRKDWAYKTHRRKHGCESS